MEPAAVARVLRETARLLETKGESIYKARAYARAADRVGQLQRPLPALVSEGTLTDIPGIGPATASAIRELVTTGRLRMHEALKAQVPLSVAELTRVPGLGAKKAAALWQSLQITTLPELESACREHRIRGVKGFGPATEAALLAGLTALRPPSSERALLSRGHRWAAHFGPLLAAVPGARAVEAVGSIRRFCETVGNVDLLAASERPTKLLDAFAASDQISQLTHRTAEGADARLFEEDLAVRLRVCPPSQFATALLYWTGSRAHLERLEALAREGGLVLRADGLFQGERRLALDSEEAVYQQLGLPFIPPELREDSGELEAAMEGRLPRLVEEGDIRGMVHCHTTWSDGKDSLEAMARATLEQGFEFLTVTEHSQTASYAGGLTVEALESQRVELAQVQARLPGIRLLHGIESDITRSGALDYPAAVLERLDVVIGSIHNRYKMDAPEMTDRVLRALRDPQLDILGHPTGRLLKHRPPIPVDMPALLDEAVAHGVVMEVNGSPSRMDLSSVHVREGVRRGLKFSLSVDAHSVRELGNLRYAVGVARKGWVTAGDVVNARPLRFIPGRASRRERG